MSMNLFVERTRPATVTVKGMKKQIVDRSSFNLWQTPTEVTRRILRESDKPRAYCEWVRSCEWVCSCEWGRSCGSCDSINEEHIQEFLEWIRESEEEDFSIEFYEV